MSAVWAISGNYLRRYDDSRWTLMFDAKEDLIAMRFDGTLIHLEGASGKQWAFDTQAGYGTPDNVTRDAPLLAVVAGLLRYIEGAQ